jgi:hypothetical protein
MNVFRILGDVSHTISKCILIWAIHWNRSAEGELYAVLRVVANLSRRLLTHPIALHRSLLYSLPGLVLGPPNSIMVELHPQELLYMVVYLHCALDDAGLCSHTRA